MNKEAMASIGKSVETQIEIHAEEFWTKKNDVNLWVYRKYAGAKGAKRPLLFLVHGSSYSGKTMFDLQVPGRTGYSFMDKFVKLGYEVWTMDHEGYGHSDRTAGFSDVASGVQDLKAAMGVIAQATGQTTAVFFGQSSGALRAAKFANTFPDHVSKLVLDAFVWTGKDAPTLIQRAKLLPQFQNNNVRKIDAAFYRTVFTRDHVGASEPMIGDVVAEEEMKYGDTVPTGTYLDMVTKLPLVDPQKITCPVLVIRAEHDGIATEEDITNFFAHLPSSDKQLVKISGLAHTAPLGVNRHRFYHAIECFLSMPDCINITQVAPDIRHSA